jgi:hypothetical protein
LINGQDSLRLGLEARKIAFVDGQGRGLRYKPSTLAPIKEVAEAPVIVCDGSGIERQTRQPIEDGIARDAPDLALIGRLSEEPHMVTQTGQVPLRQSSNLLRRDELVVGVYNGHGSGSSRMMLKVEAGRVSQVHTRNDPFSF